MGTPLFVVLTILGSPSWVRSLVLVGLIALPVSIGMAVLKYHLFDIDQIISHTLTYAIVTGLLVGVYAPTCRCGSATVTDERAALRSPMVLAADAYCG